MDMHIIPHTSVGAIHFGMMPDEVHAVIGPADSTFNKSGSDPFPTSAYDRLGFYVYYGVEGAEAVEFFDHGSPIFQDSKLIGPYEPIETMLKSCDTAYISAPGDNQGQARNLGINIGEKRPFITSMIIVEKGYFEKADALLEALRNS